MSIDIDMSGHVVLVTGGGYGMGRASALRFAAAGASVVIADIDVPHGEETVSLIEKSGGTALFVEADVSGSADVERLIGMVDETHHRLDFAHNNAGIIGAQAPIPEIPDEEWARIIANNLTSVFLCLSTRSPSCSGPAAGPS